MAQDLPLALSALARTGDPRGVPLLRKALTSPNLFIASVAAAGLAQANDLSSVPVIIDACKRLPPKMAGLLADSLLFFDDPQAQSTFASYFPTINISEEEYSAEACSRVFRSIRNKGSGKVSLQTFTRRVHS